MVTIQGENEAKGVAFRKEACDVEQLAHAERKEGRWNKTWEGGAGNK